MCNIIIDKSKRNLLKGIFFFLTVFFLSNFIQADNSNKYILDNPLAGSIYYTRLKPGRWKSISDSHLPLIKRKQNYIEVSTAHEVKGFEHYIIKHLVLDSKLRIISEKTFDPAKDAPLSRHNLSGYQGSIFILSVCNLHDTWLTTFDIE